MLKRPHWSGINLHVSVHASIVSLGHIYIWQYRYGQGSGQDGGDVKDCVIQGLEDYPHMRQSYKRVVSSERDRYVYIYRYRYRTPWKSKLDALETLK